MGPPRQPRQERDTLFDAHGGSLAADPRLVRTIEAPSSRQCTVRLDGLAHGLAQEAEWFLSTLPLDDAAAEWLRDELRVATKALRRSVGQRLPPVTRRGTGRRLARLDYESALKRFSNQRESEKAQVTASIQCLLLPCLPTGSSPFCPLFAPTAL